MKLIGGFPTILLCVLAASQAFYLQEPQASERYAVPINSRIDSTTVYNGVLDPNNIAIHVSQNFVNFVGGTIAWILLGSTYRKPQDVRSFDRVKRSTASDASFGGRDFGHLLRSLADCIDTIDSLWSS